MTMSDQANLPATLDARLPVTYEAAQKALAECSRVDECKEWADKAQALASYARQAKDNTLHQLALRIQARATRRFGELLKQVPRGDEATRYGQEGALPPVTRTQAATDAGLSEHQRKTGLRLASIPQADFEAAIDSAKPPTVTELAIRGTVARPPAPPTEIPPADPAIIARAQVLLRDLAAFCATHEPASIARASGLDVDVCRGHVETLSAWLDRFVVNLPAES
jgi:hypothetical protein